MNERIKNALVLVVPQETQKRHDCLGRECSWLRQVWLFYMDVKDYSAAGSAPAPHAGGHRFDPC